MHETKLSRIVSSKIRMLTKRGTILKLNRCAGDEYAITNGYRVLHAFESSSLSRHIALEGRKKIRGVRLVEKSVVHGPGVKRLMELHYEFCDRRKFILDERDRIFAVNEAGFGRCLHSPCGLWGLVPEEPIVHMLLTSRMVDLVESHATEDQVAHVLRIYWKDWSLWKEKSLPLNRDTIIRGEFGSFQAKRINSKLVKFDTPK